MKTSTSTWFFISISWYIARGDDMIVTTTNLGRIRGLKRMLDGRYVYEYRRVPYAKPPIGNLRFEKPENIDPWDGTLDATQYGPSCPQINRFIPERLPNTNVSEDCLHVNIYVPNNVTNVKKRSVMVYIHGGGFAFGQSMLYDGSHLAITGDVIVVTINYRLGVFGFFSTGDSVAKGNYGLWDQIKAIQWVKHNIESFGGNSESITIFGESAGGMSVRLLCLMPRNKGLFKRAIQQSGTAMITLMPFYSAGNTYSLSAIAEKLDCPNGDNEQLVKCMKELPFDKIILKLGFAVSFIPVVDGELLTDWPINLLRNSKSASSIFFRSLDVIIGTVSGEGSLFIIEVQALETYYGFNTSQGIPKPVLCEYLANLFSNDYNDTRVGTASCEKYGSSSGSFQLSWDIINAFSDYYFNCRAVLALRFHESQNENSKTFQYLFSRPAPQSMSWEKPPSWFRGSAHTDELVFLFMMYPMSPDEKEIATRLMTYWSNFAKNGNVNGEGLPEWKQYDTISEHYTDINLNVTTGTHLYKDRVNFWLSDIPAILREGSKGPTSGFHDYKPKCINIQLLLVILILLLINI